MEKNREIDIARNVKTIEWLRTEIVSHVANLFKAMWQNREELILDALAGLIMAAYLLGKRLGITYSKLDSKVVNKVKASMLEDHEIEKWYGDMNSLLHFWQDRRGDGIDRREN
ncbi:MAG: MazG-like family protein [Firmicutes bacterium]|nr:MazG-like family protein [Bacillota bacterium]MDD4264221.1 MazG-like family protein [Bacillota bacterium]MDD4693923.1 MazG-like family protein [Bacillota bacterium]